MGEVMMGRSLSIVDATAASTAISVLVCYEQVDHLGWLRDCLFVGVGAVSDSADPEGLFVCLGCLIVPWCRE